MKRIFHVVVMIIPFLGIIGGLINIPTAHAKSIQGRSAIGINALYVIPGDTDISDFNMTLETDSAVGYGLTYTHGFKYWAMDVSLDRSNHDIKDNLNNTAEVSLTTLAVSGQYRPQLPSLPISPHIGFGIGYSIVLLDFDFTAQLPCGLAWNGSAWVVQYCDTDVDTKNHNAMTLHGSVGTDYFFSNNLALGVEVRYIKSKASVWGGPLDENLFDLELDRYDIRTGIKYYF